jgi:nucleotide-binding universal stress UspA family protein
MVTIDRILCPVDLSDFSRHALRHALALAAVHRARITVLRVFSAPQPLVMPWVTAEVPLPAPIQAEDIADDVRRFFGSALESQTQPVEIVATEGVAATEIVRLAEELPADLLVLGTHGRSGFERLFLGSVTEKVLRSTAVPVMTIPPPAQEPATTSYTTILCPLDFSPASIHALDYASALAQEAQAGLILLHVIEGLLGEAGASDMGHMRVSEYDEYLEVDAVTRLKAVLPDQARGGSAPEQRIVRGRAYRQILAVAEDEGADLIVMGVQGKNALNRFFFGSTTHHVIREARCPVLTIRGSAAAPSPRATHAGVVAG